MHRQTLTRTRTRILRAPAGGQRARAQTTERGALFAPRGARGHGRPGRPKPRALGRGDRLEMGASTRGPERLRAESRVVLRKLGAAFPPRALREAYGSGGGGGAAEPLPSTEPRG